MKSFKRTVAALLFGSLSAMIPVTISALREAPDGWFTIYLYLSGLAFTLSSLAYLLLVLLPSHLFLAKRGWDRWWLYGVIGGAFSIIAGVGFDLWTGGWSPRSDYLLISTVGVISSLTFWFVVRTRDEAAGA